MLRNEVDSGLCYSSATKVCSSSLLRTDPNLTHSPKVFQANKDDELSEAAQSIRVSENNIGP